MVLDSIDIICFPIAFSDDDVLGSFRLEQLSVLFSPDDVQERDAESLAALVEHPP